MDRYNSHLHLVKHIHFNKFIHNKFNDLLIADTFRLLALSMISVFIPIYLIDKIGLSFMDISLFELATFILSILFHYYSMPLFQYIGARRVMIVSYLLNSATCFVLYLGLELSTSLGVLNFVLLTSFLNSMSLALYWSAHHIYFLKSTLKEDTGSKLGLLKSIPIMISIAGPFIGSILIAAYSFKSLFLLSTILLIFATIALFFSTDIKLETKLSWKKVIDAESYQKNSIFFLQGLAICATGFIWPVLLFVNSVTLITMGTFYLFSNILHSLVIYLGGKSSDTKKPADIIRFSAVGFSFSIISRALSTTFVMMAAFQSIGGIFGGLLNVAIDSNFYKKCKRDIPNELMNREFYMHLGRIACTLLFIFSLFVFDIKTALVFVLLCSGGCTFFLLLISKEGRCFVEEAFYQKHRMSFFK